MFCAGYGISMRERKLPIVYFIINTKHCTTYLALTQLFPVLISHPEMYTVCSISFRSLSFHFQPWMHPHGQMDFSSCIFVIFFFFKIIWEAFH